MPPQLFRPLRPFPAPLESSPPLGPTWMPIPPPPPVPPLATKDEERRPWPLMKKKMRLLFPYAVVNRVFGIMDRVWGKAMIGLHIGTSIVNIIANLLSFYIDGNQGGLWALVSRVTQFLCYVFTTFIMCALISYYMRVDGEYHETFQSAAEMLQLPPPPLEMDMC